MLCWSYGLCAICVSRYCFEAFRILFEFALVVHTVQDVYDVSIVVMIIAFAL